MTVLIILVLAILAAVVYGDYIGFWGKSPERPVREGQIKIACIGDSITYGMRVKNRRGNCYPSLLQKMLGEGYNVRNFGLNNRNVMLESPYPYKKEKQFQRSLDFVPDIVLLMLGTNDCKEDIWKSAAVWRKDYEELLDSYQTLPSNPEIYLLTPASLNRVKQEDGSEGISFKMQDSVLREICNTIWEVAKKRELSVIDVHSLTSDQESIFYKDGVHPNNDGARLIAENIYTVLTVNQNQEGEHTDA